MPTYEALGRFLRDFDRLTPEQQRQFRASVEKFVEDLRRGRGLRPGLRVKRVQGAPGIYELTWADDGRATFAYGAPVQEGEPHIVWRRIGTHDVVRAP